MCALSYIWVFVRRPIWAHIYNFVYTFMHIMHRNAHACMLILANIHVQFGFQSFFFVILVIVQIFLGDTAACKCFRYKSFADCIWRCTNGRILLSGWYIMHSTSFCGTYRCSQLWESWRIQAWTFLKQWWDNTKKVRFIFFGSFKFFSCHQNLNPRKLSESEYFFQVSE